MKKRTLWRGVGLYLSLVLGDLNSSRRDLAVLFAYFVGLLLVFISKSDLLFRGK